MEQSVNLKRGVVREDGLILLRRNYGKEIWGTEEQYKNMIAKQYAWQKKRRTNGNVVIRKWKLGEFNPDTGLYFIRMMANYRPRFGTLEELKKFKQQRREIHLNYVQKRKQKNPCINKRGDWDPILNLYFWKYNTQSGTGIWFPKQKFLERLAKDKAARKARRHRATNGK